MNQRDNEYVGNRLLDPAGPALEAHIRLRETGEYPNQTERLMNALQAFNEECRMIHRDIFRPEVNLDRPEIVTDPDDVGTGHRAKGEQ